MRWASLVARRKAAWGVALLCVLLAGAAPWLEPLRLVPPERWRTRDIHVRINADAGEGSLREAIFTADRSDTRTRIVLDVAQIAIRTPLPPLINPRGIVLDAAASHCQLDASQLGDGPVLDINARDSLIDGVHIVGARGQGVLVRSDGARLTRVTIAASQIGVYLVDGARDLSIRDSEFDGNVIGIRLPPVATNISVRDSRFRKHARAAVWAVASHEPAPDQASTFDVTHNNFDGDSQGIVLVNVPARIEDNNVEGAVSAAIQVSGAAFVIRRNQIRTGRDFGVNGDALRSAKIADNEIAHNCKGGVLLRSARNTEVRGNRLYANGYGVVVVSGSSASPNTIADNLILQQFDDGLSVIGASPVIRANRLLSNGRAGVRLLTLVLPGQVRAVPDPLLEANTVAGNGIDALQREDYRPRSGNPTEAEPADCSRRVAVNSPLTVRER